MDGTLNPKLQTLRPKPSLLCRPFGFLEAFDPLYTPNTTDEASMRYTFRQQPEMGQWNLAQLANAMLMVNMLEQARCSPRHLSLSAVLPAICFAFKLKGRPVRVPSNGTCCPVIFVDLGGLYYCIIMHQGTAS